MDRFKRDKVIYCSHHYLIHNIKFIVYLILDVNECSVTNGCHANSVCYNTYGSYYCTCNEGKLKLMLDNCSFLAPKNS